MKTWHILIALLILGAGTLQVTQQRRQHAEMEKLRKQTLALAASLEENQDRATPRLAEPPLLPRRTPAEHGPVTAAVPLLTEKKTAKAPEVAAPPKSLRPAEIVTRMETAFAREVADRDWSAKTRQVTQEKISALLPKSSAVLAMDCRTSMCRVEMSHQGLADYRKFVESAFVSPNTHIWDGPTFSSLLEGGSGNDVVAVTYLGREGLGLPTMQD